MKPDIIDFLFTAGMIFIGIGLWQLNHPLTWITEGAILLLVCVISIFRRGR
jgi:TRAP-type C4-dicarboxylate transport system permease small subunit